MQNKLPLWQCRLLVLLVFAVFAAPFFCFLIWWLYLGPMWFQLSHQRHIAETYPWNFWTINASDTKIVFMSTSGLENPTHTRMYPTAPAGMMPHIWNIEILQRVQSVPSRFTVRWRIEGDSKDRLQELRFPQPPLGSDGYYVFQLGKDGNWTMEYDPNRERPSPKFDNKRAPDN